MLKSEMSVKKEAIKSERLLPKMSKFVFSTKSEEN